MEKLESIVLSIVAKKRNFTFFLFFYPAMFSFLISIISVFYIDSKFLTIFSLIIFFICVVVLSLIRGFSIIGKLTLTSSQIWIEIKEIDKLPLKQLDNLTIIFGGFEGQKDLSNIKSISSNDGTSNFIEFSHTLNRYSYQFFVKQNDLIKIKRIINLWKNENINFIVKNR